MTPEYDCDQKAEYEIQLGGTLDPSWSDWFDGFTISTKKGQTLLKGMVPDQAALMGLLLKINQLNLPLLSVIRIGFQPKAFVE